MRTSIFGWGKLNCYWCGISAFPRLKALKALPRGAERRGEGSDPAAPVLVEACCEEGPLLSQVARWSRHRSVVGITEETDFTSKKGMVHAKTISRDPWMPSGFHVRVRGFYVGAYQLASGS